MSRSIEFWVKVAQIVLGVVTPAIAVWIGVVTSRIQRQQVKTQRQQYRFGLVERRMKIYDATIEFVGLILREAKVETVEPLFILIRETRESHLLFGAEVTQYIDLLYSKGTRLHSIWMASGAEHIIRPGDIEEETQINHWFTGQVEASRGLFLKYLDFREP